MKNIPLWIRRATVDFIETLIPSLLMFNWLMPRDALVPAVITAVGAAGLSTIRRNYGLFTKWLNDVAETDEPADG